MAQQTTGDFDIDPATDSGTELAGFLNRMNAAELSMHSGATAPAYKLNNMLWMDTTSGTEHICKRYNSTGPIWVELFRVTVATGAVVMSANTAPTTGDHLVNKTYADAQIATKQATLTGATSDWVATDLTASRALASSAGGKIEVSAVTATELGYLDGVTSAIQTQLGTKAAIANVLELDNTDAFTPDADHEPATKKYVDDNAGGTYTAADAVGATGLFRCLITRIAGETTAASNLMWMGIKDDGSFTVSGTPTGTWVCLGATLVTNYYGSVFQKIA